MARIRTVKPEFWRDEKIASLKNKLAGYFFIGLWNISDDEGKFPLSPKALSLQLPIFRQKEISTYLSELTKIGLVMVSQSSHGGSQWGLVVNWNHQKISKPIVPRLKVEDIQWFPLGHSWNPQGKSGCPTSKDRIVKDSIVVVGEALNQTQKFDARFSPDFQTLKTFFNDNKMGNLNSLIPDILNKFGNVESFDNWYQGLTGSKTFPKDQDFANQSRYITTSLKKELGLIPSEARNA